MKQFNILALVRSALDSGWADPATRYGSKYTGWFDFKGSRVFGAVAHFNRASRRPPTSVVFLKNGEPLCSTTDFDPRHDGTVWWFEIDTGLEFTPDDVIKERFAVAALDRFGARSVLKISGATQLRYIKDASPSC